MKESIKKQRKEQIEMIKGTRRQETEGERKEIIRKRRTTKHKERMKDTRRERQRERSEGKD